MRRCPIIRSGLVLIVLGLGCGDDDRMTAPTATESDSAAEVRAAFVDATLAEAVVAALAWRQVPLDSLDQLSASDRGITDLRGIGRLKSLTALDLSNNRIADLTPLDSLSGLRMLDLSWNQVSDLAPLKGLELLETLVLEGNRVQDLEPLLGLPGLASLELTGNPLSAIARDTQVLALQARGIGVIYRIGEGIGPYGSIAFSSDRDGGAGTQLYLMDADGSHLVRLTDNPDGASQPQWSPQGDRLVFVRRGRIMVMDLAGGTPVRLSVPLAGYQNLPCWSPDGNSIAFTSDVEGSMEIHVMAADGGQLRSLRQYGLVMSWSPDGESVLYARGPLTWRGEWLNVFRWELQFGQPELWVAELESGAARRLMVEPQDGVGALIRTDS